MLTITNLLEYALPAVGQHLVEELVLPVGAIGINFSAKQFFF
jgi:hypothetical protein